MYYGFNKDTLRCMWSIDQPVSESDTYDVVESNVIYDITTIQLVKDKNKKMVIGDIVLTKAEIINKNSQLKSALLREAKDEIDLLADVVEYSFTDEKDAMLKTWKKYRVDVYNTDASKTDVVWPDKPSASTK